MKKQKKVRIIFYSILIVYLFHCPSFVLGKNSPLWYVPAEEEARELLQKYNPYDNDAVELVTGI